MRYLILRAHDVYNSDKPDVVYLDFYDHALPKPLALKATLFDINSDGKLDWSLADDINNNGVADKLDEVMALEFAQQFMEFNWFSPDAPFDKYLKIFAEDFDANGIPDTVRLHFHQGAGEPRDETIAYTAALYKNGDGSGNGTTVSWDVNNDGKANAVDNELVRRFCRNFLVLGWHDAHPCKPPKKPNNPKPPKQPRKPVTPPRPKKTC